MRNKLSNKKINFTTYNTAVVPIKHIIFFDQTQLFLLINVNEKEATIHFTFVFIEI